MSDYQTLRITRAPEVSAAIAADWVRLEQIAPASTAKYASLSDVYRAWTYAATGKSSRTERPAGCPVEFDGSLVRTFLGFYAWPSRPDVIYDITSSIGVVGPAQLVNLPREFSAFANNTRAIDLPYYMEDVEVDWETPVYNRYGEEIPAPAITNNHTSLSFSTECFGALRVAGKAVGAHHILTIEVDKKLWDDPDVKPPPQVQGDVTYVNPLPYNHTNADKITSLEATVTATWQAAENVAATDQLRLEIPQCILDVLAYCPGNPLFLLNWCETVDNTIVYYSSCVPDTVLKVCNGLDPHKYCTQIAANSDPGPWLKGVIDQ